MNLDDKFELDDLPEESEHAQKPGEILRNDYGDTKESTVVVEEEDRTVILTDDETIILDKQATIDITPSDRPRKVYAGMWGTAEIITVSLALMAILATVLLYVFVVFPAQRDLEAKKKDRKQVEIDLTEMDKKFGSMENAETEAAKLITSVNDFEGRFLKFPTDGKSALYERLNGLIYSYSLTNTSGPIYTPLEIFDPKIVQQRSEEQRGRDKYISLYPGVFVSVTVEGSYQRLRGFMSEVENSSEFITITSVELVPSETEKQEVNNDQVQATNPNNLGDDFQVRQTSDIQKPKPNRGKTRGEIVSLKVDMVSYFRRPDFKPMTPEIEE